MNTSDIACEAALLLKRYNRAQDFAKQTGDYLTSLEQSIPPPVLTAWRGQEAEWEERVVHIEEEINLESHYELKQDKGVFAVQSRWGEGVDGNVSSQLSPTRSYC